MVFESAYKYVANFIAKFQWESGFLGLLFTNGSKSTWSLIVNIFPLSRCLYKFMNVCVSVASLMRTQ